MAQSALTVTPPTPSPPTNIPSTGVTGPNPTNLTKLTYLNFVGVGLNNAASGFASGAPPAPLGLWSAVPNPPPFYDDGIPNPTGAFASINEPAALATLSPTRLSFATNTAALSGGTGATSGGTENTYPGTDTAPFEGPNMVGPVPASTSVAAEGAATEVVFTAGDAGWPVGAAVFNPTGALKTVATGPSQTAASLAAGPNASHLSTLSPVVNPTLTAITPGNSVSGVGTTTLGATGTGFTKQSVVYVNGVPQLTAFVSSTSLTVAAVTKKATAGSWLVTVVTGGVVVTAPQTWTFT